MFVARKSLPRRTFLRGAGVTIALPLIDAMVPAFTPLAKAAANPRLRFGVVYIPNGVIVDQFFPKTVGSGFEFLPIVKSLETFKDSLIMVSNLTRSHPGSQVGDHAVSAAGFLTGVWPKRTEAEFFLTNTKLVQFVAQQIGQDTPLPSLEVATEDFTGYVGGCSPGFSCAYLNTISWSTPSTPLPMEINPRSVFERMFGEPGTAAQRLARTRKERSILDSITEEASDLQRGLGTRDRARVGDFLYNIREIERRIQQTEAHNSAEARRLWTRRFGVPESFEEHVALMYDLLAAAYQADVTRVFTFMLSRELSQRTYPQLGVTEQHPLGFASYQRQDQDREECDHQHLSRAVVREVSGEVRDRRRMAMARCWIIPSSCTALSMGDPNGPQFRSAASGGSGWWRGAGTSSYSASQADAGGESLEGCRR